MSTPNGAKDNRTLRRTLIAFAVIVALVVLIPIAVRATQASQRDLNQSLQNIQQAR
jgi:DMSO/TMAO reductase YedYZ heme-binding membrane subunit